LPNIDNRNFENFRRFLLTARNLVSVQTRVLVLNENERWRRWRARHPVDVTVRAGEEVACAVILGIGVVTVSSPAAVKHTAVITREALRADTLPTRRARPTVSARSTRARVRVLGAIGSGVAEWAHASVTARWTVDARSVVFARMRRTFEDFSAIAFSVSGVAGIAEARPSTVVYAALAVRRTWSHRVAGNVRRRASAFGRTIREDPRIILPVIAAVATMTSALLRLYALIVLPEKVAVADAIAVTRTRATEWTVRITARFWAA